MNLILTCKHCGAKYDLNKEIAKTDARNRQNDKDGKPKSRDVLCPKCNESIGQA